MRIARGRLPGDLALRYLRLLPAFDEIIEKISYLKMSPGDPGPKDVMDV